MKTKFNGILTLLLALTVQFVFAQKAVSGTVSDETGALPGVSVLIKGTSTGTETDFDGKYSIQAKQGDVLQFSFIGMETVERTVGTANTIDVSMKSSNILDEVVVTAFGKKKTKNEFTGSAVTVDSEQISKNTFVSPEQALQGKVAGLKINVTSGTPGSNQQISIRGLQSVTASNDPLIIVDGVAINQSNLSGSTAVSSLSPLATLSSNDIESITVLKDAISTSPYGPAGSNGVIMIVTKSGKQGATKYSLNSSMGYANNSSRGLVPLNGEQKLELVKEAVWNYYGANTYGGTGLIATKDGVQTFMNTYSNWNNAKNWINAGMPKYNWEEEIVNKNAFLQNIDFSVSQGSEKSNLYASIGFNDTESTVIGSDFSRLGGLIKYKTQLSDKIQLALSVNGSNTIQNASLEQSSYFSNPNLTKFFITPWVNPFGVDGKPDITSTFTSQTSVHNTLFTAVENIRRNDVTKVSQGTELKFDLYKGLVFKTNFNLEYSSIFYKNYQSPKHGDGKALNGYIEESVERVFDYTTQNSLDYTFKLADKHGFTITGLMEFIKFKNSYLYGYGTNLPGFVLQNLSATSAAENSYSSYSDRMTLRYVGMLNYNFDGKYLIDGTYSYQGDSRFSNEIRYDDFYSVGLGWNIHKENFMENVNFINELRLKASYGLTGNYGIGRNAYQYSFAYNTYNGNPATYVAGFGTTAGWEKGLKRDLALEFTLLDRKLRGNVAYFSNITTDMLFNKPLPMSSTYPAGSVVKNMGEMTNKGYEVEIGYDIIRKDNFNWNISGNFATLDNMVTKLPAEGNITGSRVVIQDKLLWEWYLPLWKGVDPANGLPVWYIDETKTETTNTYSQAKRVYQGTSAIPTFSGGLSTRFDIKNFFVEGGVYFSGGNQVYEDWAAYTQTSSGSRLYSFNATTALYDGVWRQPGDIATHPRMDWANGSVANAAGASTRFLYDGDYIRLRDIAVGYKLTKSQFKMLPFESITLTAKGNNLFTWVKDSRLKWDPEVRVDGYTNLTTPPVKTIVFNLNVNF